MCQFTSLLTEHFDFLLRLVVVAIVIVMDSLIDEFN